VQGSIVGSAIDFAAGSVTGVVVKLGNGNDILINTTTEAMIAVGGAGTDIITDAGGRGILIGGAGSDILSGGGGQDILIDSGTDHDADDEALLALLAYWNNTSLSLSTRVNNLLAGNGVPALNGDTIHGDGAFDLLIGGGATDWILLHSEDLSLGLGDILDDVDDL
jgi:Ca2+-binding RTX toxin-like protein